MGLSSWPFGVALSLLMLTLLRGNVQQLREVGESLRTCRSHRDTWKEEGGHSILKYTEHFGQQLLS